MKDFLAQLKWPKAHEDILRARASPKFLDALQQFAPSPPGVMRQLKELANRRPPPLGVPPIELLEMLDSVVRGATGGRSGNIFFSSGPNPFGEDSDDFDSDYDDEGRYTSLSPSRRGPRQPTRR